MKIRLGLGLMFISVGVLAGVALSFESLLWWLVSVVAVTVGMMIIPNREFDR